MKSLITTLLLLSLSSIAGADSAKTGFDGEISDTQCAMNVHSLSHTHDEMIAKQTFGTNAASCARTCVRRGGEWVLRSGNEVYRLKNQDGMENFAGEKVHIVGRLDNKTKTIDNLSIENKTEVKSTGFAPKQGR